MGGVRYPDVVYGSLLSLYEPLGTSTILQLEKAILHRNLRNFSKSLAIFDSLAPLEPVRPAIVLEHTWTLIAQYRFKEARSVAATGLFSLPTGLHGQPQHGPTIVLRAFLAGLDALIDGAMHGCYQSLGEIYQWLSPIPFADFTDVQVWALNLYYYLPSLYPTPPQADSLPSIPSTPTPSPSSGITLLRTHLQRSGRLNEALCLLDTETTLLPSLDASIAAMESLRSACLPPSTHPLPYIQGVIALKLALLYASLGDEESYREEAFNAAATLSSIPMRPPLPPDGEITHPNNNILLRTDTWLARLELASAKGERPGAVAWEKLADYAKGVGDYGVEAKALMQGLECMICEGSEEVVDLGPEVRGRLRGRLDELYVRLGGSFYRGVGGGRGCGLDASGWLAGR